MSNRPTRLIVLGSSPTALAVVREAAALGIAVEVIDSHRGVAMASRHVRHCSVVADAREAGWQALRTRAALPGSAVIACSDAWVALLRDHRAELDALHTQVLQAPPQVLATCLSKAAFITFCRQQALPTPRAWLVADEPRPQALAFPLMLRPVVQSHGLAETLIGKAREVRDEAELAARLLACAAQGVPLVVTESLLGRRLGQYSVGFARMHGRWQALTARKLRPLPDRCDAGSYVELTEQAQVLALARRCIEAMDYVGIGEVEVLRDEDSGECFLVEVNARPWLQYALARASGHNFLAMLLGDEPAAATRQRGRAWIAFGTDLFHAWSRSRGDVRSGRIGLLAYLGTLWRANVPSRLAWDDPAPAWPALAPWVARLLRQPGPCTDAAPAAGVGAACLNDPQA